MSIEAIKSSRFEPTTLFVPKESDLKIVAIAKIIFGFFLAPLIDAIRFIAFKIKGNQICRP
jgi:hypothetical protein